MPTFLKDKRQIVVNGVKENNPIGARYEGDYLPTVSGQTFYGMDYTIHETDTQIAITIDLTNWEFCKKLEAEYKRGYKTARSHMNQMIADFKMYLDDGGVILSHAEYDSLQEAASD